MRILCKILSVILVVLFVIMIPVNVVVRMFDNTISLLIAGNSFWELENKDPSAVYYKGEYANQEERLEAGQELCYQVELEGAALLLNNKNALPLALHNKVTTLSVNSVDLTYGGTGSGNVDASKADNLKAALEKSGFIVNPTVWDWYNSEEATALKAQYSEGGGAGENDLLGGQAPIVEINPKDYPAAVKESVTNFADALIITFSRVGGEGYDCSFPGYEGVEEAENYLALNENERALLAYAEEVKAATGAKIIVLINTSNALQVDFLKDYDVDACLWVGGLGISGTNAVTDLLAGYHYEWSNEVDENGLKKPASATPVSPSGGLVDTYCYDNLSSPAMQNFIAQQYANFNGQVPDAASTYMIYQEGIYVGYKYYETRYYDYVTGNGNAGDYNYHDDVAFTFGYGESYTSFTYKNLEVNYNKVTDKFEFTVTVINTGAYPGKDTVEIYVQSPYTEYDIAHGIEKAAVQLVGFGKTKVIEPGMSDNITIEVDRRDIASYDSTYVHADGSVGSYILDEGTYYFTLATDAHNAVNNILFAQGYNSDSTDGRMDEFSIPQNQVKNLVWEWVEEKFDAETYSVSLNGTPIRNQLQDADPNHYFGEGTVTFLSRNDWTGTWPTESVKLEIIEKMIGELAIERWATIGKDFYEYPEAWNELPKLDQKNGLTLYDMFILDENGKVKVDENGKAMVKPYDHEDWYKLLENLTLEELLSVGDCFHWRHPVPSVNAPGSRDENGPQGLTVSLFGGGLVTIDGKSAEATAFTSEDVMAATFNLDLMYEIGTMIANDCLDASVSCLYGPGANTHRTPYGGRNFEYYSEDGFLAGEMAYTEVNALLNHGVDVVLKHFALNDTEQDRLGQAAWLTEQAARELYLKAFQKALEENGGRGGVMTAYTRWGTTWTGYNQKLMTGILRGEWGNKSMHITDNIITDYCDASAAILAGGITCFDAMMPMASDDLKATAGKLDPVIVNALVEAMHHNLYTIINSAAMNGVGPETTVKAITPNIINLLTYATVALGVLGIGGCILFRKRH